MTVLTFIQEPIRVKAYVWVIAVRIIKPYGMVHDLPGLFATHLTQTTINRQPVINKCLTCSTPGSALIELFLGQHCLALHVMTLWTVAHRPRTVAQHRPQPTYGGTGQTRTDRPGIPANRLAIYCSTNYAYCSIYLFRGMSRDLGVARCPTKP